ncbi:MAG: hypothetical protein CMC15_16390, partial [Flavobacteriaceae bacterium]|nr:hypothetical protein [Flavobacteriaceae bacterium]
SPSVAAYTTKLDIGNGNTAVSQIRLKDNDATDGWYVESNQNFAIGYNATDTINITQAGLHGINTSSPSEALTVSGNIDLKNSSGFAKIDNNGALSIADDAAVTLSSSRNGSALILVYEVGSGIGALFFTCFGLAVTKLAGTSLTANSDSDGDLCCYNSGHTITVKNRLGATKSVVITVLGGNVY